MIVESLERLVLSPDMPRRVRAPSVHLNVALEALIQAQIERERQFTARLIDAHHGRDRWGTLDAGRDFWRYRAGNLPIARECRCSCGLCAEVRAHGKGWVRSPITMAEVQRNADGTPNPTLFGEAGYDGPDLLTDPLLTRIATGALATVGTEEYE